MAYVARSMSAALATICVILVLQALPQASAARSTNKTSAMNFNIAGGWTNVTDYQNPQVQQILNFTLDAIALRTNHTAFNHTGHVLKVHIDWVKTQVVAGINYLLRFTVVAKHLKRSYEAEVYKAINGNVTLTYLHHLKSAPRNATAVYNVTETGHAKNETETHVPRMTLLVRRPAAAPLP